MTDPLPTDPFILDPDQSHCQGGEKKYILTQDVYATVHTFPTPPAPYRSAAIDVLPQPDGSTRLVQHAGYRWDGPPFRGAIIASCPHDGGYSESENIATAWNWALDDVLTWFNSAFRERMEQEGTDPAVREVCFTLVAAFGADYHAEQKEGLWAWIVDLVAGRLERMAPKVGTEGMS